MIFSINSLLKKYGSLCTENYFAKEYSKPCLFHTYVLVGFNCMNYVCFNYYQCLFERVSIKSQRLVGVPY